MDARQGSTANPDDFLFMSDDESSASSGSAASSEEPEHDSTAEDFLFMADSEHTNAANYSTVVETSQLLFMSDSEHTGDQASVAQPASVLVLPAAEASANSTDAFLFESSPATAEAESASEGMAESSEEEGSGEDSSSGVSISETSHGHMSVQSNGAMEHSDDESLDDAQADERWGGNSSHSAVRSEGMEGLPALASVTSSDAFMFVSDDERSSESMTGGGEDVSFGDELRDDDEEEEKSIPSMRQTPPPKTAPVREDKVPVPKSDPAEEARAKAAALLAALGESIDESEQPEESSESSTESSSEESGDYEDSEDEAEDSVSESSPGPPDGDVSTIAENDVVHLAVEDETSSVADKETGSKSNAEDVAAGQMAKELDAQAVDSGVSPAQTSTIDPELSESSESCDSGDDADKSSADTGGSGESDESSVGQDELLLTNEMYTIEESAGSSATTNTLSDSAATNAMNESAADQELQTTSNLVAHLNSGMPSFDSNSMHSQTTASTFDKMIFATKALGDSSTMLGRGADTNEASFSDHSFGGAGAASAAQDDSGSSEEHALQDSVSAKWGFLHRGPSGSFGQRQVVYNSNTTSAQGSSDDHSEYSEQDPARNFQPVVPDSDAEADHEKRLGSLRSTPIASNKVAQDNARVAGSNNGDSALGGMPSDSGCYPDNDAVALQSSSSQSESYTEVTLGSLGDSNDHGDYSETTLDTETVMQLEDESLSGGKKDEESSSSTDNDPETFQINLTSDISLPAAVATCDAEVVGAFEGESCDAEVAGAFEGESNGCHGDGDDSCRSSGQLDSVEEDSGSSSADDGPVNVLPGVSRSATSTKPATRAAESSGSDKEGDGESHDDSAFREDSSRSSGQVDSVEKNANSSSVDDGPVNVAPDIATPLGSTKLATVNAESGGSDNKSDAESHGHSSYRGDYAISNSRVGSAEEDARSSSADDGRANVAPEMDTPSTSTKPATVGGSDSEGYGEATHGDELSRSTGNQEDNSSAKADTRQQADVFTDRALTMVGAESTTVMREMGDGTFEDSSSRTNEAGSFQSDHSNVGDFLSSSTFTESGNDCLWNDLRPSRQESNLDCRGVQDEEPLVAETVSDKVMDARNMPVAASNTVDKPKTASIADQFSRGDFANGWKGSLLDPEASVIDSNAKNQQRGHAHEARRVGGHRKESAPMSSSEVGATAASTSSSKTLSDLGEESEYSTYGDPSQQKTLVQLSQEGCSDKKPSDPPASLSQGSKAVTVVDKTELETGPDASLATEDPSVWGASQLRDLIESRQRVRESTRQQVDPPEPSPRTDLPLAQISHPVSKYERTQSEPPDSAPLQRSPVDPSDASEDDLEVLTGDLTVKSNATETDGWGAEQLRRHIQAARVRQSSTWRADPPSNETEDNYMASSSAKSAPVRVDQDKGAEVPAVAQCDSIDPVLDASSELKEYEETSNKLDMHSTVMEDTGCLEMSRTDCAERQLNNGTYAAPISTLKVSVAPAASQMIAPVFVERATAPDGSSSEYSSDESGDSYSSDERPAAPAPLPASQPDDAESYSGENGSSDSASYGSEHDGDNSQSSGEARDVDDTAGTYESGSHEGEHVQQHTGEANRSFQSQSISDRSGSTAGDASSSGGGLSNSSEGKLDDEPHTATNESEPAGELSSSDRSSSSDGSLDDEPAYAATHEFEAADGRSSSGRSSSSEGPLDDEPANAETNELEVTDERSSSGRSLSSEGPLDDEPANAATKELEVTGERSSSGRSSSSEGALDDEAAYAANEFKTADESSSSGRSLSSEGPLDDRPAYATNELEAADESGSSGRLSSSDRPFDDEPPLVVTDNAGFGDVADDDGSSSSSSRRSSSHQGEFGLQGPPHGLKHAEDRSHSERCTSEDKLPPLVTVTAAAVGIASESKGGGGTRSDRSISDDSELEEGDPIRSTNEVAGVDDSSGHSSSEIPQEDQPASLAVPGYAAGMAIPDGASSSSDRSRSDISEPAEAPGESSAAPQISEDASEPTSQYGSFWETEASVQETPNAGDNQKSETVESDELYNRVLAMAAGMIGTAAMVQTVPRESGADVSASPSTEPAFAPRLDNAVVSRAVSEETSALPNFSDNDVLNLQRDEIRAVSQGARLSSGRVDSSSGQAGPGWNQGRIHPLPPQADDIAHVDKEDTFDGEELDESAVREVLPDGPQQGGGSPKRSWQEQQDSFMPAPAVEYADDEVMNKDLEAGSQFRNESCSTRRRFWLCGGAIALVTALIMIAIFLPLLLKRQSRSAEGVTSAPSPQSSTTAPGPPWSPTRAPIDQPTPLPTTNLLQYRTVSGSLAGTAGSAFGQSVAVEDTLSAAGAPDEGVVYTFTKDGAGDWIQLENLTPGQPDSQFGTSIDMVGAGMLIGAPGSNLAYFYVFDQRFDSWSQLGATLMSDAAPEQFGASVAVSKTFRAAIGAPAKSLNAGGIYLFQYQRISANSSVEYEWLPMEGSPLLGEANDDRFGTGLDISLNGNRLIGGAPFSIGGYAYVYQWSTATQSWELEFVLPGIDDNEQLGASARFLSSGGEVFAVGSPGYGDGRGAIRVFSLINDAFTQLGSDIEGEQDEALGLQKSLAGNSDTDGTFVLAATRTGMVKRFDYDEVSDSWIQRFKSVKTGVTENGISVASVGANVFMAGDASKDQAQVYEVSGVSQPTPPPVPSPPGSGPVPAPPPTLAASAPTPDGPTPSQSLEYSLSGGPFVGESLGFAVAQSNSFAGAGGITGEGRVDIYRLRNGSWTSTESLSGNETGSLFGYSIALRPGALLVGAPQAFGSETPTPIGTAAYYELTSLGWTQIGGTIRGEENIFAAGETFGSSVAASDQRIVACGAPNSNDANLMRRGRVYALSYRLDLDKWTPQQAASIVGDQADAYLGFSVDISADATTMVAGGPGREGMTGYVVIYTWNGSRWAILDTFYGDFSGDEFGTSVKMLDDDGRFIAAGGPGANGGSGLVRVFRRRQDNSYAPLTPITGNGGEALGSKDSIAGSYDGQTLTVLASTATGLVHRFDYNQDTRAWDELTTPLNTGLAFTPPLAGTASAFVVGGENQVAMFELQ